VKRHDYLPFGEELLPGTGGRTSALGYAGDGVRQQFTRKERDVETGLDYFLARYCASTQGRFTSPDEFTSGPIEVFAEAAQSNPTFYADLTNPQTLNKYQYCLNNPLRYTDPYGHQQQDTSPLTKWLQSMIRQLLKQKDQYPDEPERRGPLSLDQDEVNARATQAAGEAAKARADLLKMTGLDFGTLELIESAVKEDAKGTAIGAIMFAANAITGPSQKSVVIGENMVQRVIPVATEIGAKTYSPTSKITANWLQNNARWIATQISKGNRIFDIGMDVNRAASNHYAKEVEILKKKGFERVKVGVVTIGKKSFELYEWVKSK
jgi:RHS repeat-associated protein